MKRLSVVCVSVVVLVFMLVSVLPVQAYEMRDGKKIVVFGARQPVPTIDPSIKYDWSIRTIQQSLYDALTKYVGNPPKLIPWLAESWEGSPDATVFTFHLVKNAKFHNGDPVTAEAVKFSFARTLKLKKGPAWMLLDILDEDGIEVIDDYTIKFTLNKPYAPFEAVLPWWYVMNPKQVMEHDVDGDDGQAWLTEHEAGSGPFTQKRWEQGVLYELEAVEDYWKGWENENHIGGYIFKLIREASSQKIAIQKGDIDIAEGLSPEDFDLLAQYPGIYVVNEPGITTFGVKMNVQKGYTADINVRKAISYAFDYDAFVDIYNGNAILEDSPFPKGIRGYMPQAHMYQQDLEKAKEHLQKSQYPDGGFELEYIYVQGLEEEKQIGLVLLDALSKLNIKVKMVPLTWPNMVARGSDVDTSPDFFAAFVTPIFNDPDAVAYQYHKNSWGKYYATSHYNNEHVWELIDKARVILDWDERQKLYTEIQKMIVDDAPEIFGMQYNRRWAFRDHVKGFVFCPVRFTGEIDMHTLSIEE
ncbi:MAG: ABC transporter substrate-binding protein [bacterium]|nr:ABC transporter substrate-binding protein [bacterium]